MAPSREMPVLDASALMKERIGAIRAYHEKTGIARAEIDVSGGVDSATLLGLLAEAIGPDRITAAYLSIHSSETSHQQAHAAAEAFGVALVDLDLTPAFELALFAMRKALHSAGFDRAAIDQRCCDDNTVLGSFRSCFRAPIGRGLNRLSGGGIRHGTGNECEDRFIRFYQKGGDGEVDTNPLAMLAKGEIYQLACALGVPRAIIDATPTPDLAGPAASHKVSDEAELHQLTGLHWTYSRVDGRTGSYVKTGTIERMSRFLDAIDDGLFASKAANPQGYVPKARSHFPDLDDSAIEAFLASARRLEGQTRHKANPNCPMLGSRIGLLRTDLISNELPRV
ncbi:MAG: NAD(+) synthase [Nannocystaceae bacterium]